MKKLLHICLSLCVAERIAQENQKIPKLFLITERFIAKFSEQPNCFDGWYVGFENREYKCLSFQELPLVIITNVSLIQKATLVSYEIKYEKVVQDYSDKTPLGGGVISYGPFRGGELRLFYN